jgi:hypothetical protein
MNTTCLFRIKKHGKQSSHKWQNLLSRLKVAEYSNLLSSMLKNQLIQWDGRNRYQARSNRAITHLAKPIPPQSANKNDQIHRTLTSFLSGYRRTRLDEELAASRTPLKQQEAQGSGCSRTAVTALGVVSTWPKHQHMSTHLS